jgi:hypothetical protein
MRRGSVPTPRSRTTHGWQSGWCFATGGPHGIQGDYQDRLDQDILDWIKR